MKKILLSAIALVAFGAANAQEMKFGAKAGANFSNFTGDLDSDSTTSFYLGGFVDFTISEKFHVQPEVLYSMEGAKDAAVNFIKIPVMAKYYVAETFNIQAGPYIGFKAGADSGVDDAVKSMDFGIGAGAAYDITGNLFVDARYNIGLQNISENSAIDVKTSTIQIGLGYRF